MIPLCRPFVPAAGLEQIHRCLDSGWLGYGPACRALEERFAARGGWSLATSSCTSALYLAGQLCRRAGEAEVIVPALTFISTAMAFEAAGLRVRLADVDRESLLLTAAAVEAVLSPRTVAVVAVHLYGQRCPLGELRALCDRQGLLLIEDCAHRLDLLDSQPPAGDLACYSFNAVKEAPGGEGGLLWGRDPEREGRARSLSNLGMSVDTWQRSSQLCHRDYAFDSEVGLKLRLNDVSAALVLAGLDCLGETRRGRAAVHRQLLEEIRRRQPRIGPLPRQEDDSWLMCVVRTPAELRAGWRAQLARHGVATSIHYPSLSRHPRFTATQPRCPVAESADQEILTIPCYPALSPGEIETIVAAFEDAGELLAESR